MGAIYFHQQHHSGSSILERLLQVQIAVFLVLRLRKLEMDHDMIIHVVCVSGKRMIAQGTDGLSRADHLEDVMQGHPMMEFIPLHWDPFKREPRLKLWLESITKGLDAEFLNPEGWFVEGQGYRTYGWTAAPAEAEVIVEQLEWA